VSGWVPTAVQQFFTPARLVGAIRHQFVEELALGPKGCHSGTLRFMAAWVGAERSRMASTTAWAWGRSTGSRVQPGRLHCPEAGVHAPNPFVMFLATLDLDLGVVHGQSLTICLLHYVI